MSQLQIPYTPNLQQQLTPKAFSQKLIAWYNAHKRDLPWRQTKDPYKIWLSEIILQQTRVAQGLPYYQQFVARYPSVKDLAHAEEQDVMRLWQGLGYYSRARNMHACARMVVAELNGKFPNNYQDLLKLKGVGKYTAAAIASIAFKEPVAAVDGNVYRVLARIFGITADIASTHGAQVFSELAQSLVPQRKANLHTQAIMEFGAMHCTPTKPKCPECPFKNFCVAFNTHRQYELPVKSKKIQIKKRFFHYVVLQCADKLYMKRREKGDIWEGLYDFYLVEKSGLQEVSQLEDALIAALKSQQITIQKHPKLHKHLLTHRKLYVHFFHAQVTTKQVEKLAPLMQQNNVHPFSLDEVQALPKPILIKYFLEEAFLK